MRVWNRALLRIASATALAFALGACSSNLSLTDVTLPKPGTILTKPDWATFSGGKNEFELRPITAADLVGPEGQCAAAPEQATGFADPAAPGGAPASSPPAAGGISLQMTECDVVRRAGAVEKVDFGVDERGQRAVTMTYTRGPWPGIYRFAGGRLISIERVPGPPPAPAKPEKAGKSAKKPAGT
jgi:hypothetical protein